VTVDVPYHGVVGAALRLPIQAFRMVGGHDDAFLMNSEEIDPIGHGATVGRVPARVIDSRSLHGAGS